MCSVLHQSNSELGKRDIAIAVRCVYLQASHYKRIYRIKKRITYLCVYTYINIINNMRGSCR